MTEETRHQRYFRILEKGVAGNEDYEDARYLIDKGYLEGDYLLSNMAGSYGKVISVVSRGPTPNGIDFVDELRVKTNDSKVIQKSESNNATNAKKDKLSDPKQKSSLVVIAEGVAVLVLAAIVFYLFHEHFGISLQ